ncbi:Endonuclease/exonuclease/phosphatase [Mucor mucedo]|uniref:Endonuclease/exonuclease/phosphatase n=1 Tax=Mucor mucedo TaxID=29922 RepID=UPI00221ED084|nr:Endonuclease/exonuclease/phosphatase [Mucor mucedo]KAI7891131.1 Endonuclease/exonuclease/phosphatase [Mucor mucedo]
MPLYSGNFNRYPLSKTATGNGTGVTTNNNNMNSTSPRLSSSTSIMLPDTGNTGNSIHVTRQLTYAQNSRQSSSPHHHARTAAAMARSTPVSSTVTITDPNNPTSNKIFNRIDAVNLSTVDDDSGQEGQSQTWTTLDIGGMGLKQISPTLCSYTFLTVLYMNHNNLTHLSSDISKLVHLKTLDCSGNKLSSLPSELGLLSNLRDLLLFDNNLSNLPSELGMLYQLEMLGLEGNPMQADIKNILMKEGTQAVIVSLRENAPVGMPPPHREWITIENDTSSDDSDKFTVLSYNILCDKYATSQVYGYTPSWALNWDYRKELIISEVLNYNADIVCLQEVAMKQYEEALGDAFKERGDYDGVFFPKSRAKTMVDKERRAVDGCAIFYKASKYDLIEHHLLEYNQKALQRPDFKASDDIYNRVMTKDNVAVMIVLENKETLARLLVVNSHIHWHPQDADVKLVQTGMLMDELDKFAAKHLKPPSGSPQGPTYSSTMQLPTVICGDFNSTPDSGVYEFLSKSVVRQDHPDFGNYMYGNYTTEGLSHRLALKSTYSPVGELDMTNYTPGYKGTLDYIWYTNNTMDVMSLLGGISQEYLDKVVGFPNPHFPSDHIPLMAELRLKSPRREKNEEPNFGFTSRR